jgi:hypothetical protein
MRRLLFSRRPMGFVSSSGVDRDLNTECRSRHV